MKSLHVIIKGALVIKRARTWAELDPTKVYRMKEARGKLAFILIDEATTPPTLANWGLVVELINKGGRFPPTFIVKKDGKGGIFATDNWPDKDGILRPKLLMRFA